MIRDFLAVRRARAGTSALVRMPTGTGKSGVIAVAAHNLVQTGDVLLLTPWDALVTQLADDVRRRFWEKIGAQPPTGKPVKRLYPSTAARELAEYGPGTIWMATIATLQQLYNGYQADYRSLAHRVRLVVVDEGHYEPALIWAKAVRGLNRPTVLFTATPYRNDLKYFNVDRHRHSYQYSHAEAESEHYLRGVRFETHDFDSPESFCDALLAAVDRRLGGGPGSKVIVRCQSQNSVQRITMELKARQRSVVGIHERFQTLGGGVFRRHVPKEPGAEPAQFWVHQHKLTEGIDAAQFKMVAFYEPFSNERAFVQQVGRVLRNPGRDPGSVAWVFSSPAARLEASWDTYRSYDLSTKNIGLPASPRKLARQQLVTQYFDGRFRTTFDLDAPDLHLEFLYPLSVRAYDTPVPVDLDAVAESVDAALEDSDCERGPVAAPLPGVRVHPYIAVRNSPLLARSVFTEFEVGFTVYRQVGHYLFHYDTQGIVPARLSLLAQVEPGRLRRLYSGWAARLTSVSTINTDLGPHSPRRRSLRARSVDELGPDLSNHAHLAATVTGRTAYRQRDGSLDVTRENQTRHRYVGFTKSRIRDGGMLEFGDYVNWIDSLASSLDDQDTRSLPVFDRYAEVIDRPANVKPANILLDIPASLFETIRDDGGPEWLDIEDLCMDVADGTFRCVANDAEYAVGIAWDSVRNRYNLSCPDLDERFSAVNATAVPRARTLISYLNDEQAFRVIPASAGADYCIYTGRLFCRPRLPLGGRAAAASLDLLELISGVDALTAIKSEKGEPGSATGDNWAEGSLFHLIDTLGDGTGMAGDLRGVDLLVCDDMGTESADFLALDPAGGRAIAMHLKAFPTAKKISASALHEVSSQALKNLGYLQPYVREAPKNVRRWSGRWDGGSVGRVDHRIRKGAPGTTGSAAWQQFLSALRDPKTSREVWLVLGQGPPKSLLVAECRKRTPTAELIQMLYSLQSTWTSVASLGAKLRVFSAS